MKNLVEKITVVKLMTIIIFVMVLISFYSFVTKQFLALDSIAFLLSMIKHGGFIDFYVDRQFANYFTQLLPYLALKLNFFTFEQMQYIWGLSFIGIPISILLISLKNFSKSYRDLNLFLMVVILFFMPQFGRWVSEAIICLSLTVYIFSVLNKEAISKIEVVLMTLFSLILIKSYSTTAFTNLFLIYLVFIHKNLKLISKKLADSIIIKRVAH